jgi:DNA-binding NarL/FixJ family response regulator
MKAKTGKQPCPGPQSEGSAARTIRTFLVDDDPLMLALLAQLLSRDERMVIVGSATDGRNAFQPAVMSRPDLALVDLQLPGVDGAEVTRWLKQLRNPPVVFIVTSDNSPEARARSLGAGADAFLVKAGSLPVQLQAAIHNFFDNGHEEKKEEPSHAFKPITPAR